MPPVIILKPLLWTDSRSSSSVPEQLQNIMLPYSNPGLTKDVNTVVNVFLSIKVFSVAKMFNFLLAFSQIVLQWSFHVRFEFISIPRCLCFCLCFVPGNEPRFGITRFLNHCIVRWSLQLMELYLQTNVPMAVESWHSETAQVYVHMKDCTSYSSHGILQERSIYWTKTPKSTVRDSGGIVWHGVRCIYLDVQYNILLASTLVLWYSLPYYKTQSRVGCMCE